MFLITTADQRFWKTDEKVLFLGEWCKIYEQQDVWAKLDYQVLPYHWDNRERMYRDYLLLRDVYERYLERLSAKLNDLHQIDRSVRYWRIIIGPWLYYFIQSLHDRYQSINNAAKSGLVTNTWIFESTSGHWTPWDFSQFTSWFISDAYNHYLYSYLIRRLGQIPFQVVPAEAVSSHEPSNANESGIRKGAAKLVAYYWRLIAGGANKIVFVGSDLSLRDLVRIQFSLRQWPYISSPRVEATEVPVNHTLRDKVVLNLATNEFESILDDLIPRQIPVVHLEAYVEMRKRATAAFPKQPALIFTPTAHSSDEGFKVWSAEQVERGARLAIATHGGGYGSCLWMSNEEHEIEVSDRYYTWGWQTDGDSKTFPLSVRKFANSNEMMKPRRDGTILWVVASFPRYSYWMYSVPVGPQTLNYFDDQRRFAQSVSTAVHELLLLRLYVSDYGWNELIRWREVDPALSCYQGPLSMEEQLSSSRLMIATYNATTFLGTFAANFPTVMFWNPKQWELRAEAKPYYDDLRDVGILHDTPESAAFLVNEIYDDPQSWWLTPKVQQAKARFCHQFVRTNKNWRREWKLELLAQVTHVSSAN